MMKNNDINLSEKGQAIAQEFIRAVRDHKKGEFCNKNTKFYDCVENNRHVDLFLKNISEKENYSFDKSNKNRDIKNLINEIKRLDGNRRRRRKLYSISLSVAAALLFLSFLIYYQKLTDVGVKNLIVANVEPEIKVPTLISSGGETKNLDEIFDVNKASNSDHLTVTDDVRYNMLIVPSGYILKVILSDSSEVVLNANSKLKYPEAFSDVQREVILDGEAYFNIRKSKIPFVVVADNSTVKVYGTQFNINNYNKNKIKTTLIRGLVGVSITGDCDTSELMLQPNSMLEMNALGERIVSEIDASRSIMWMNGDITSKNEPLKEMLDKISRWYDVKFIYNPVIKDITITATFSNTMNLEKVIENIMLTTDLVIIKQKNGEYMIL